ncbi:MAG TPA: hypothetical protein VGB37_14850 [Candidatus Lokiarchaeia archaeon]
MAKEKFRTWNFRGDIKVKYTDGSGAKDIWQKNQEELLQQIVGIVENYLDQNITLTNRQLYYQLVSRDIIPNADEIYKRICTFLTDARYAGLIDWEAIEDRGRTPEKHSEWNNIKSLIESATYTYRLPRWKDQDYYIELYCEKQAMESVLKPVADKYHIYFGVNKGYSSASTMYDLAQRIKEKINEGKRTIILYLGDHDPSGLDMVRDIHKRICEFLTAGDECVDVVGDEEENPFFRIVPLALNMKQIKQYNPPPNPAKITDPRAKWYIKEHGNKSWELDALEPKVLIKIAEIGVQEFIDLEKYDYWIKREKKEKKALEEFGDSLLEKEENEDD